MKIQITDGRLENVKSEDVRVSLIEARETVVQVIDEMGDVKEMTLNLAQAPVSTSLGEIDLQIADQQGYKLTAEQTLADINAKLTRLQTLRASIATEVATAKASMVVGEPIA